MRITIAIAEEAVKAMADVIYDVQLKHCHDRLASAYENYIAKVMPKDVLNICKKYPDWVSTTKHVHVYVNGEYYFEDISISIPSGKGNLKDGMSQDDLKEITKIISYLNEVQRKKREFKEKTMVLLLSLKTRKRIEEIFPEAMEYINWPNEPLKNLPAAKLEETRWLLSEARKNKEQ